MFPIGISSHDKQHVFSLTLEEVKTERSQQSRGNWKKTYDTLQKVIRMQTKAWTPLDGGSQLYNSKRRACIHA